MMTDTERARAALYAIPPNLPRDEWHEIGRAGIAAGLTIDDLDAWSAPAENYKGRRDVEAAFKNITPNGGTGAGTLIHKAKQYGFAVTGEPRPTLTLPKPAPSPQTLVKQAARLSPDEVWERCIAATPAEAYIHKKQGKPDGLRVYPASASPLFIGKGEEQINAAGGLVVPCYAPDGVTLQTLQIIPLVGQKKNLPGASFGDGFFTVGEVADRVYICEGIGQAWAVNQATGCAAVVCFGAGRMARVAAVLREKYPAARLIIVPDKGQEAKAATIAADVAGLMVTMPTDKPGNYDANDFAAEYGSGALAALLDRPQVPLMRFKVLSGADLCNAAPMRWMVRGVLPVEGLAALYGASGGGKSFLMLDIAAAVAGGDYEWFGRRVTQCPVTYACLEGEAGIGKRVKAWSLHHNKPVPDALRFIAQPFDMLSDDVGELAKAIIAGGGSGGLVIIDTLNRAAPGADENSSVDMGNLIAAAKQLQTLIGGLVCLVHHTGKDASKGLRGHSSLYAALDGAIEVTATDTRRAWSVAKCKDDTTGDAHPFRLDIVPVGTDEDGEPITSCTVHPVVEVADSIRKVMPPKSGNQRAIWDALGEIFRKAGNVKPEGAPDTLPQGRPCITLEAAIDKTRGRLVCDPKRQTERAQAAIRGLVERGLLCHEGGFVWCK